MRAKFRCNTVAFRGDPTNPATSRTYELMAVYDQRTPENERFAKATPFGRLEITIDNPDAVLMPGEEYYLDFTPCNPVTAGAWRGEGKAKEAMGNTHDVAEGDRWSPVDRTEGEGDRWRATTPTLTDAEAKAQGAGQGRHSQPEGEHEEGARSGVHTPPVTSEQ